jgi:hypothetical protein
VNCEQQLEFKYSRWWACGTYDWHNSAVGTRAPPPPTRSCWIHPWLINALLRFQKVKHYFHPCVWDHSYRMPDRSDIKFYRFKGSLELKIMIYNRISQKLQIWKEPEKRLSCRSTRSDASENVKFHTPVPTCCPEGEWLHHTDQYHKMENVLSAKTMKSKILWYVQMLWL